jgi:quercetin dioxygenase-like cupin family protein
MPVQKQQKGDIVGRQLVVKDLLAYQEGAVVSRTLIDKQAGTVTIFSFDEGQGLSEHTAPYDALVHVLEGQVEIAIAGVRSHLKEGDMIVLPGGKPHALRAVTQFKMMLVMVRSEDKPSDLMAAPIG